jgi:hypothetical protein
VRKFVLYSIAKDKRSLHYPFAGSFTVFEELYKSTYPNNYSVLFEAATQTATTTSSTARSRTSNTATMSGAAASAAFANFLLRNTNNTDNSDISDEDDDTTVPTTVPTDTILIRTTPNYENTFDHQTVTSFGNLLYQLFSASWASYLAEHDSKMLNIKLNKFATSAITSTATDNVARQLNSEPTVDPKTLNDLIRQNVANETKELRATIQKLQQQARRPSKNASRGDNVQRFASSKKKSKNTTPQKPRTRPNVDAHQQKEHQKNVASTRRPRTKQTTLQTSEAQPTYPFKIRRAEEKSRKH